MTTPVPNSNGSSGGKGSSNGGTTAVIILLVMVVVVSAVYAFKRSSSKEYQKTDFSNPAFGYAGVHNDDEGHAEFVP
jgi:hypothetical protein